MDSLIARYKYSADYIPDYPKFLETVMNKTVVPYQVEFQPGPVRGNICWLKCPYCYGGSAKRTDERLPGHQFIRIMDRIARSGIKKVIFAGYCTDPLNYEHIEDLLETAIEYKMVFGFNTKALKVSDIFLRLLEDPAIVPHSYINISVDSWHNASYNAVHGVQGYARLYDKVLENVTYFAETRETSEADMDISATYLIMDLNASSDGIKHFVEDFRDAGCDLIRFTFPQPPKGKIDIAPNQKKCSEYRERLLPLIKSMDSDECRVLFVDVDTEHDIFHKARTLPCLARWVYPSVGFDGWLYPCSQTAAPNFRKIALGNLAERDFWDIFYDYDLSRITYDEKMMEKLGCRCDRKEHVLNGKAGK